MKTFLIGLLFPLTLWAQSSDMRIVEGAQFPNASVSKNYIKNSTCDKNVNDITKTGSATLSASSSSPIKGAKSCAINASASTETITWAAFTSENELKGQNCEAKFKYSGDASLYKAYVKFGSTQVTSSLQLTNAGSNVVPASLNFPCGDNSSSLTFVLEATGDGAAITVDDVYMGLSTNVGTSQGVATLYGTARYAGTTNCDWSTTSATFASFSTDSDCPTPTVTGGVTAPSTKVPGIRLQNAPPGEYLIIAQNVGSSTAGNTSFVCSTTGGTPTRPVCGYRFNDGTTAFGGAHFDGVATGQTTGSLQYITGNISYTSAQSDITIQIQADAAGDGTTDTAHVDVSTAGRDIKFLVYRFPTTSEVAVRNPVLYYPTYSAKVSSGGTVSDESSDWINGNCSVANTSEFTCTWNSNIFSSAPNCVVTGLDTSTAAPIGKIFTAESTSSVVVKTYNNSATATAYAFRLVCQATAASSVPVPLLVGSVTSNSTGAERVERVSVTSTCSSSPCTIASQSGSWVSSITRNSTGDYTVNFTAGMFSAAPACTVMAGNTTNETIFRQNAATTTSAMRFITANVASSFAAIDGTFDVLCMGPK